MASVGGHLGLAPRGGASFAITLAAQAHRLIIRVAVAAHVKVVFIIGSQWVKINCCANHSVALKNIE